MSPMILTDKTGDVRMVIGGVGGRRIIPAVTQVRIKFATLLVMNKLCNSYSV